MVHKLFLWMEKRKKINFSRDKFYCNKLQNKLNILLVNEEDNLFYSKIPEHIFNRVNYYDYFPMVLQSEKGKLCS